MDRAIARGPHVEALFFFSDAFDGGDPAGRRSSTVPLWTDGAGSTLVDYVYTCDLAREYASGGARTAPRV